MKKITVFLFLFVFAGLQLLQAQTKRITGTVTSAEDGMPIPGISVVIKGTSTGITTDIDGKYSLDVPQDATTIVFSFIGMKKQEIAIGASTVIDAVMELELVGVEEVVVTALGVTREKKSLGYAVQEIKGEDMANVKTDNFVNSLSGKVSGVQIKRTTNMGGSTNVSIRGIHSITGDNQALFVVDGVPISNAITNSRAQEQGLGGVGYDYGNAASDINTDDIESINVLKGAAASALYGSRAANGVVMITTKRGAKKEKGFGVTVGSGITIESIDKSTFPKYQTQYGAGYGQYYDDPSGWFWYKDITGDGTKDLLPPLGEDASYGAAFDPTLMVYQWDALDSESPNYMTATPWVAAENGPITFFETPVTYNNTVSIDNAFEKGNYRFSYTNYKSTGLMPNSELKKNSFTFGLDYNITDKLKISGFSNYISSDNKGRNSTGYNDNILSGFRQWWQVNVDVKDQKDAYFRTGRNATWNYAATDNLYPIYWDNLYWTRYENYQTDGRDRFIGNMVLNYKLTKWLDVMGRVAVDTYDEIQEERRQVGSVATRFGIGQDSADGSLGRNEQQSGYQRKNIAFREFNYDLMFNYNYDFSNKLNLRGVVGSNIRRSNYDWILAATNGGIGVPGLFSLQNTIDPLPYPKEAAEKIGVDGIYGSFSLGYDGYLFLDGTLRRDHSSTLPADNSVYYYPSISTSYLFNKFIPINWISLGKVRLNYAEVGNSAKFDQIIDTYNVYTSHNAPITSVANTKNNAGLKPERIKSIEGGLEMSFVNNRVGFDLAFYKTRAVDQILPVRVSSSTGYFYKLINAGEIENKGIEVSLTGTPVKGAFTWDVIVNWTRNRNKVVSLVEGLDNYQLGSFQQGISVNAMVGEPYGVIFGTDYTYHENGGKLINAASGEYIPTSTSDHVIGDVNPDWTSGITNSFSYKRLKLSFLVDIQKGGDIWSLDMSYGLGSGLYEETAFTNDLGYPVRNSLDEYGGFVNEGVNPDGSENTTRIRADRYGAFGYRRGLPNSAFIYDASYVKLREVALNYDLPEKLVAKAYLEGASISFTGSNLWIIYKNFPYSDPESGLGAGNVQGFTTGAMPSTRQFGFNVKLQF